MKQSRRNDKNKRNILSAIANSTLGVAKLPTAATAI